MDINASERIGIIMDRLKITTTKVAEATGQSRQNLTNKFTRGNLSEKDLQKIASAMGCTVEIVFTLPDGSKI